MRRQGEPGAVAGISSPSSGTPLMAKVAPHIDRRLRLGGILTEQNRSARELPADARRGLERDCSRI